MLRSTPRREAALRTTYRSRLLSLACCLLSAAPAAAQNVRIAEVRVGFPSGKQDHFKAGAWTPVMVELEAQAIPFQGTITVETADGDGALTLYKLDPVYLDPAQQKQASYLAYTKIGSSAGNIKVYLEGKQGNNKVELVFTYEPWQLGRPNSLDPAATLVLCLGRPRGLEHEQPAEPAPTAERRDWEVAFQTDVNRLPDHWFGYEAADVVILPTGDTNFMRALAREETKRTALAQWVQMGGHLVVSVGGSHNFVANRQAFPLEPLLPALIDPNTTIGHDRLHGVEAFVRRKVPIELAPFTARSPGGGERRPPLELAKLTLRPLALTQASEQNPQTPAVVHAPYGLGRVTLIGFDTDQGAFAAWEGRQYFWTALLGLRTRSGADPGNATPGQRPGGEAQDLAAKFCEQLEQFGEVPVIQFGWVALFIFIYILIVGPLDYLFLKKVVKRMEWTWITFPVVVAVVSLGAYFLANHLKGNQLRINKIDLLDIDLHTQYAYGSTWFTVFSPQLQHYDLGLEPAAMGGGQAEGLNLSWMGRLESGMRGLRRGQSPGLFSRSYEYERAGRGLKGVPIQVWSVKTFTGRWLTPLDAKTPVFRSDLERVPDSVRGRLTSQLPWTLRDCRLIYRGSGWNLGDLQPGQTVEVPGGSKSRLELLIHAAGFPGLQPLLEMMSHSKLPAGGRTAANNYLDYVDQSHRMDVYSREALLIGIVEEMQGPSPEVNAKHLGCRLQPFTPTLSGTLRQNTVVRVFLPIAEARGE